MSRAQSSVDGPCLSVNVTALITTQEEGDPGNLVRVATSLGWIQLPNLLLVAPCPGRLVDLGRHARFDEAGADGVDAHARPRELERYRLRKGHYRGLGGGVGSGTGVGADAGDGSRANDAASRPGLLGRCLLHGRCGVLRSQEDAGRIH